MQPGLSDEAYQRILAEWDAPALPPRPAQGYWATAAGKVARNPSAMTALILFLLVVIVSLLAPLYAHDVSRTDPFTSNLNGTVLIHGAPQPVMQAASNGLGIGLTPVGPNWRAGPFMLGADGQGRDIAARLLYGGQNSLLIGGAATVICLFLAAAVGIVAGFFGGVIDRVVSIVLDVLWAFPIYLLAISLSIILISKGITIGALHIGSDSLLLPIIIIGIVYVPYVARPIRAQVLTLRRSEFILASTCLGVSDIRMLWHDILPNVASTLIVFAPLMMALNILTEAALSFLSIGVQPPNASWGTIIRNGENLIYTRPMVAIAPGIMIVITVLALNILGDGLRDALDPRAKIMMR